MSTFRITTSTTTVCLCDSIFNFNFFFFSLRPWVSEMDKYIYSAYLTLCDVKANRENYTMRNHIELNGTHIWNIYTAMWTIRKFPFIRSMSMSTQYHTCCYCLRVFFFHPLLSLACSLWKTNTIFQFNTSLWMYTIGLAILILPYRVNIYISI